MSFKTEVCVNGEWATNAVVLATKEEAESAGKELLSRWFLPTDSRAIESQEPVNYRFNFSENRLEAIQ